MTISLPINNLINEKLFVYICPFFNTCQKRMFKRTNIDSEPLINYSTSFNSFQFCIQLFIFINLKKNYDQDFHQFIIDLNLKLCISDKILTYFLLKLF